MVLDNIMKNSKNSIIAKRYAKSLIEINKEDKVSYDVIVIFFI